MRAWIRKILGITEELEEFRDCVSGEIGALAHEFDRENQARKEETKFLNRKLDMLMMGAQPGKDE
jgi:hypothetical protein